MKQFVRLILGSLMIAGTLAAATLPTTRALFSPGEGSDPIPACYPTDPKCPPPIPPPAGGVR